MVLRQFLKVARCTFQVTRFGTYVVDDPQATDKHDRNSAGGSMTLRQFIESNNLTTLQAVKAKLTEQVLVDTDFWTWAGIAEIVGVQSTTILEQTIRSQQLNWAADQLSGKGMQLGHPLVQGMMDQFIAAGLTFCSLIKAKPYKHAGRSPDCLLQTSK